MKKFMLCMAAACCATVFSARGMVPGNEERENLPQMTGADVIAQKNMLMGQKDQIGFLTQGENNSMSVLVHTCAGSMSQVQKEQQEESIDSLFAVAAKLNNNNAQLVQQQLFQPVFVFNGAQQ